MPFVLQLLRSLKQAGWKVKIHDSERLEPPHVTIYQKMRKWRLSLRDETFLYQGDKWSQIDSRVKDAIERSWEALIEQWDAMLSIPKIPYSVMMMSNTLPQDKRAQKPAVRQVKPPLRFIILDSERHWLDDFGKDESVVCTSRDDVLKALERVDADSIWISRRSKCTEELVRTLVGIVSQSAHRRTTFGRLLTLEAAKTQIRPTLEGLFSQVVGVSREFKKLPMEELAVVLRANPAERRDVFIGGVVNRELGTLVLVRGSFERVVVPLSMFRPSGTATPNFSTFELGDYGHTLRFGDYEATADVVLWQVDSGYRKRAKAKERLSAKGFGPSLRRLRLQRGLSQSDIPYVSRRTISRIEKGEIEKPHGATLNRIAKALGVRPEEIESY